MRAGEDAGPRFELGPVELELALSVGKEGGAGGKVRFWVAELDTEGKASHTSTRRIKPQQPCRVPDYDVDGDDGSGRLRREALAPLTRGPPHPSPRAPVSPRNAPATTGTNCRSI